MNMINKFQEKLKNQILYLVTLTMFFVLVFFLILSQYFNKTYLNTRLDTYNTNISLRLDDFLENIDKQNIENLNIIKNPKKDTFYTNLYKINNKLNIKSDVIIYDHEKNIVFSSIGNMEVSFKQYLNILLTRLDEKGKDLLFFKLINKENQLIVGSKDENGYSLTVIKEVDLRNYIGIYSQYIIKDDKGYVLVTNNEKFVNLRHQFIKYNENEYILNNETYKYKEFKYNEDLSIISFTLKNDVINIKQVLFVFIILFIVIIGAFNYYSKKISINTGKSLDLILKEIKNIKDHKAEYLQELKTDDEFSVLSVEINKMLKIINDLNTYNTDLLNLNKQIEIKQLEAQFNPHFLYNTLETIRYVMLMDTKLAGELIIKLNNILRYSISNKVDMVKFNDDIVYINNYLEICKVRFQERFDYTLKIDERCKDILIPKLIIQPLIENTIKHNYVKKDYLSIWITAEIANNNLIIEIEDSGEGIDEESLKKIDKSLESGNPTTHIGIYNVYRRLKLNYDEFGFDIYSKKDVGTKIAISIRINEDV